MDWGCSPLGLIQILNWLWHRSILGWTGAGWLFDSLCSAVLLCWCCGQAGSWSLNSGLYPFYCLVFGCSLLPWQESARKTHIQTNMCIFLQQNIIPIIGCPLKFLIRQLIIPSVCMAYQDWTMVRSTTFLPENSISYLSRLNSPIIWGYDYLMCFSLAVSLSTVWKMSRYGWWHCLCSFLPRSGIFSATAPLMPLLFS